MYKIPRQSYTADFKREAVRLVQNGHKPAAVAKKLGISEQTLGNCRNGGAAGRTQRQTNGQRQRHAHAKLRHPPPGRRPDCESQVLSELAEEQHVDS